MVIPTKIVYCACEHFDGVWVLGVHYEVDKMGKRHSMFIQELRFKICHGLNHDSNYTRPYFVQFALPNAVFQHLNSNHELAHRAATPVLSDQTSHLQQSSVSFNISSTQINSPPGLSFSLLPSPSLSLLFCFGISSTTPYFQALDLKPVLEIGPASLAVVECPTTRSVIMSEDSKFER